MVHYNIPPVEEPPEWRRLNLPSKTYKTRSNSKLLRTIKQLLCGRKDWSNLTANLVIATFGKQTNRLTSSHTSYSIWGVFQNLSNCSRCYMTARHHRMVCLAFLSHLHGQMVGFHGPMSSTVCTERGHSVSGKKKTKTLKTFRSV